jgi:hypothetical protein
MRAYVAAGENNNVEIDIFSWSTGPWLKEHLENMLESPALRLGIAGLTRSSVRRSCRKPALEIFFLRPHDHVSSAAWNLEPEPGKAPAQRGSSLFLGMAPPTRSSSFLIYSGENKKTTSAGLFLLRPWGRNLKNTRIRLSWPGANFLFLHTTI